MSAHGGECRLEQTQRAARLKDRAVLLRAPLRWSGAQARGAQDARRLTVLSGGHSRPYKGLNCHQNRVASPAGSAAAILLREG
jgi:hypothetical protein